MKGKSKLFNKATLFLLLIITVLITTVFFFYLQVRTDRITAQIAKGETFAVQFMIRDEEKLLFSEILLYNPKTGKAALVDIPGNVGTIIESLRRVDRIDTLFKPSNTQAYRDIVESFSSIEVPFYMMFSLDEIEKFVDLIGGVEVFIANTLESDSSGNKILLPSGNVLLDGGKLRSYLSFLDPDETELDRVSRMQKFLQGMLKKIGEEADFLTNDNVVPFIKNAVNSNLDTRAILAFIREMVKIDSERMVFQRVLGTVRTVDTQELLFPHFEGQLLRQTVKQIYENLANAETGKIDEMTTTVEILNGTKTAGLARRTREIFQSFGFEVVSFSNAENQNVTKTVVIDRKGNPESAGKVAGVIRCSQIVTQPAGDGVSSTADVTIILGSDFDGRYCK